MPVSSQIAVWYSKTACSTPWRHLGLVRRVRGQQLAALQHGVDDGRHVVVVDAGAEEADLVDDVLRRELLEVALQLRLRQRRRDRRARARSARPAGCRGRARRSIETPIAASIASRSASVSER